MPVPMKKKYLLHDVATLAGCSVGQASMALNHMPRVSLATRKRVLEAARKLKYRQKCGRIAVTGCFYPQALIMLQDAGFEPIFMAEFDPVYEKYFDGVLHIGFSDLCARGWADRFRLPLVTVNDYGNRSENISSVLPDALVEMDLCLRHLITLGHRRIARLCYKYPVGGQRYQIRGEAEFFQTGKKLGLATEDLLNIHFPPGLPSLKNAFREALAFNATALIVIYDMPEYDIRQLCNEYGKAVPDDLSLIVLDESSYSAELGLTGYTVDWDRLFEVAIKKLTRVIGGENKPEQLLVPGCLNIRSSTGKVPQP